MDELCWRVVVILIECGDTSVAPDDDDDEEEDDDGGEMAGGDWTRDKGSDKDRSGRVR